MKKLQPVTVWKKLTTTGQNWKENIHDASGFGKKNFWKIQFLKKTFLQKNTFWTHHNTLALNTSKFSFLFFFKKSFRSKVLLKTSSYESKFLRHVTFWINVLMCPIFNHFFTLFQIFNQKLCNGWEFGKTFVTFNVNF